MGKRKDRSIPITPEIRELLLRQRTRLIEKFGREPRENDPIFFDPTADQPQPMNDEVVDQLFLEAMRKAKVPAEIISAYQKTGRLVTRENARYLSKQDLDQWQEAIEDPGRTRGTFQNRTWISGRRPSRIGTGATTHPGTSTLVLEGFSRGSRQAHILGHPRATIVEPPQNRRGREA